MNRRELVLDKLQNISDEDVKDAIMQLTLHVRARLRWGSFFDRTKTGAHSENNLGMDSVDYYVGESIRKLFEPQGWDWKFEKFSFAEQLKRIANKLISDKVSSYKNNKESKLEFIDKDIEEIYNLSDSSNGDDDELFEKLRELAYEVSKDDDNLAYFSIRYFESANFNTIAEELGISVEQVYVLRKKLVRRLIPLKNELIQL